jgi:hypothetical protein
MDFLPLLLADSEGKPVINEKSSNNAGMDDAHVDGTDSSTTEREAAIEIQKAMPDVFDMANENRSFLRRCVRYMLGHGINQFIDIGSGFLSDNFHELVHSIDPIAKVVYADRNLAVVEQGNKFLATTGTTAFICADLRQPKEVLENLDLTRLIDFSQPVGILMMRVSCFFTDSEITHIMSTIQSTLCEGSYIAVTHDTLDAHKDEKEKIAKFQEIHDNTSTPHIFRNHKEVSRIFQGLHLVQPGVAFLNEWRIELDLPAPATVKWLYGGLARTSAAPSIPATSPQMYVNLIQLRKALNTTALTSTSLFVIIWCFVSILVQSFMDVGIVSFQQLKDMALDGDEST